MSDDTRLSADVRAALTRAPWRRYVALGDSLSEGFGMDPVEGVQSSPWPQRVANALRESQPGLEFVNLSRRNLKADEIRAQQLDRALALEPDFATVTAGPNDLLDPDMTRESIERELDGIFGPLARAGATVLTFTYMDMPGAGILPEDGAKWLAGRMEVLHDATWAVAERHGALVVDLYGREDSARAKYFSADLQHANALGQQYIAEHTLEFLARYLINRTASASA